ncbi:hypothetical protein L195_g038113, partial [Trifolium pratense]
REQFHSFSRQQEVCGASSTTWIRTSAVAICCTLTGNTYPSPHNRSPRRCCQHNVILERVDFILSEDNNSDSVMHPLHRNPTKNASSRRNLTGASTHHPHAIPPELKGMPY